MFRIALFIAMLYLPVQGQQTESELAGRFAKAAAAVFERAKAGTTSDSAALLRDFVGEGASRLVSDKKTSEREIAASVELLRRFAGEMVKQGARQADGTVRMGETAFVNAQRTVCPLYPFC